MNRNLIIEKLKEIFILVLNRDVSISAIEGNMRLKEDFGISSVGMMYLAIALEQHFGINMDDVSTQTFITLDDVVGFLEENLGG